MAKHQWLSDPIQLKIHLADKYMEFIYNSSNPNADTRQRLEGITGSEEGCQQLVLRLTKATKTSQPQTEMHTGKQLEELVLELHN